jgi:hypothetical protein
MRNLLRFTTKYIIVVFACVSALSFAELKWGSSQIEAKIFSGTAILDEAPSVLDKANPHVKAAIAVKNRHASKLMAKHDVVGTAVGLNEAGKIAIIVFAGKEVGPGALPKKLDGIPVSVIVTGEFFSLKPGQGKGRTTIDPTARFERPVPIGVSTGNENECSAGTIGARVKDSSGVYALSNNHVYALENKSSYGSKVLQPGLYDTACVYDPNNVIGALSTYVPLKFDNLECDPEYNLSACNIVDAAIAGSSVDYLGNSTPTNGYGTPKSTPVLLPELGTPVQKYGRTTSLTKGTITAINATVRINYDSGVAFFADQVVVTSKKPFIKPGDSGSLLVTDPGCDPIGLLFAGDSSGKYAIANPIGEVLDALDVTIDGN